MTRHKHSCGHVHDCEAPDPVDGPCMFSDRVPVTAPVPPGGEELRGVPTNAELAERAKSLDAYTVVRNWLDRHVRWPDGDFDTRDEWLTWAAQNFLADPEVSAHLVTREVAEAEGRRRAAEELRAIVLDAVIAGAVMHTQGPIRVPVTYLEERAAALAPEGDR